MGDFKLSKKERIVRKTEFFSIIKHGTRYHTQHFTIIILPRKSGEIKRFGISVGKKVGGAVKRNRVKRLLREFFRLHKDQLPESSDFFFIAKPESVYLTCAALSKEMGDFFKRFQRAKQD